MATPFQRSFVLRNCISKGTSRTHRMSENGRWRLRSSPRSDASSSHNIFEIAKKRPESESDWDEAFDRIFEMRAEVATCQVGEPLSKKYGVAEDNKQTVVSVTNRFTLEQTWFNEARTMKPQTFTRDSTLHDPTDNGTNCDFCKWSDLTAVDDFGRIEMPDAVTGSNLFKYCSPSHGIILFKHHNPLHFTLGQLSDLLMATSGWVAKAHALHRDAVHPLFIWNCLPRAGASQFHGHAQVMLSKVPFPADERIRFAASLYEQQFSGHRYLEDVLKSHASVGLLRACGSGKDRCFVYPSLTPWKDMEVVVWGPCIENETFQKVLHSVLRLFIDDMGVATFNVGIQGMRINQPDTENGDLHWVETSWWAENVGMAMARVVSRAKLSSMASDFGGLEVFGGASIGHTDPFRIVSALDVKMGDELSEIQEVEITL